MADRGERRARTKKIQKRRYELWKNLGFVMNCVFKGKAKKSNFSCGCPQCKPWKHGIAEDDINQRRAEQDDV